MPPSYTAAFLLARALVDSGLTQVVISPGSRSTPLTAALTAQPNLRCYPALDERGAAFFALGLALASGQPAALVCTSGTAAANYYPAVIEANQSRVPLLLLTADRPHELRDSGANQTIDQIHLYGSHVRWFVDAPPPEDTPSELTQRALRTLAARALYTTQHPLPGPVHINLPYRKPLNPPSPPGRGAGGEGNPPSPPGSTPAGVLREGAGGEGNPPSPPGSTPAGVLREGAGGDIKPPLPLGEGWGEGNPPSGSTPAGVLRAGAGGDIKPPLPLGEGWGEGNPPSPFGSTPAGVLRAGAGGDIKLPLPLGEGWGEGNPPSPFGRWTGGEGLRILPGNLLPSAEQIQTLINLLRQHPNPLILCGPRCPQGDFPNQLVNLARKTNATLIADIASGLRFGAHVPRYPIYRSTILQHPTFPAPTLVLQFGAFPIATVVEQYLAALPPATLRIAITPYADFPDPTHRLNFLIHTNPTALLQALNALYTPLPSGEGSGVRVDTPLPSGEGLGVRVDTPLPSGAGQGEGELPAPFESETGCAGSNLVLASSLPIRIADSQWQPHPIPLRVFANRGASGIDGTIATAAGIAAVTPNAPFTLLYIGDIAFYHDLNSLHLLRHAAHPVIIVLLNNNGGRIFEQLPIAEHPNLLNDWFVMPHGLTFEGTAQTFGLKYMRVAKNSELNAAIQTAQSTAAHTLIELIVCA